MFDRTVTGMGGIWGDRHPVNYHIYTGYKDKLFGDGYWYVAIEQGGNRKEEKYPSEYEADRAAEQHAIKISRSIKKR